MAHVPEMFGSLVFNDKVMKAKLPQDIYKTLRRTMITGKRFNLDVANVVANAMKEWAVENGATHYTHWFQPMTGITAEKHESFISPTTDGHVLMEFSGTELVRGEPDASSLPSGGFRATFEARGYTVWDPTSCAFLKDNTLYIPTAFCSYGGEALDKKTPLLRSMEAIDKQAMRILKLFGNCEAKRVITTVGAEQEYFLVDSQIYEKRPDLMYCGRTLFGARPSKGQELDDHYCGTIKRRVSVFMKELEEELWKLGIPAKTRHNETAPSQHELATVYTIANVATDHNQLTMELMKSIAQKHNLVCLLHEKPYAGINGSGKHNNWSIATDTGKNLLEPGDTPSQNARFLLFLSAVIKAVHEYQDLLRVSVASAGNDHRLGGNEAPPAIVSMFLGEELTELLEALENETLYEDREKVQMEIGARVLPHFPKDTTDRNRTSPFAFTGNKFEFRMPGSSFSVAGPNVVLNTIVAEELCQFADVLENSQSFQEDLHRLIVKTIKEHKKIVFNGNNYADEWVIEAEKRGLLNLKTTVDALPTFVAEKNIKMFTRHHVYTEAEIRFRYEILLESYCKTLHIEALTMIDMVSREIIPAVLSYEKELAQTAVLKKSLEKSFCTQLEENLLTNISMLAACLCKRLETLEYSVIQAKGYSDTLQMSQFYREHLFVDIANLREVVDELETQVSKNHWPYPTYAEIIYSVK